MLEASLLDVAEGARSPLELAFLRNVERAHGLPRSERQLRWGGRRVIWIDVDHLLFRTRVELDGQLGHQGEVCGTVYPSGPRGRPAESTCW
jgi:hypothetical protein